MPAISDSLHITFAVDLANIIPARMGNAFCRILTDRDGCVSLSILLIYNPIVIYHILWMIAIELIKE